MGTPDELAALIQSAVAGEREACALLAERAVSLDGDQPSHHFGFDEAKRRIAEAIRART